MRTRPLGRTGLNVSAVALGGAAVGQQYGPVAVSEIAAAVHFGLDAGINLIDMSAYYGAGRSEEILGGILAGGRREKVILCTKAGRLARDRFDFSPAGMRACLEGSLRRLRTDAVDILLAHDIEYAPDPERVFDETYGVLRALRAEGKTRFIGVSCYPLALLRRAVTACDLDVVISFCHYTLQNRRLLAEFLPAAQARGVGVMNASPLGMGLLTDAGPPPWHPAGPEIRAACRAAAAACRGRGGNISALAMQFCYANADLPTTITGTAKRDELEMNLRALDAPPDPDSLAAVEAALGGALNATW